MNANEIIELLFNEDNRTKFNPDLDSALSEARSRQIASAQEALVDILQRGMRGAQLGHQAMIGELINIRKEIRNMEKRQREFARKRDALRWILDNTSVLTNQQAVLLFDSQGLDFGMIHADIARKLGVPSEDLRGQACSVDKVVKYIKKQMEEDKSNNED